MNWEKDITINDKKYTFKPLEYYDGVKSEVSIEGGYLLHWYDSSEEGEIWFLVKAKELLKKYLENKLGLKTLIEQSNTILVFRSFEDYNYIKTKEVKVENVLLPEDIKLGFNFFEEAGF